MNHEVACAIGFGIAKLISYLFMQFIQKVQMLGGRNLLENNW